MRVSSSFLCVWMGFALLTCACRPAREPVKEDPSLAGVCVAHIQGVGKRRVESDYLPHVVACENGMASYEALKAQAVAARSFLYYKLAEEGGIGDGQHDQVYSCSHEPTSEHYLAVLETEGEVLLYEKKLVAAFYVAGAIPSTSDCEALSTDQDPTSTETYVTYNQGSRAAAVIQSPLGWVDQKNVHNRGTQSQNGAACLAKKGWNYQDILYFYYGQDVALVKAPSCL